MKNCPYCGQPNPEENQFCGKCGKEIVNVQLAVSDVQVEQTSEEKQSAGKQRAKKIVVILVLIAVVLGIVYIALHPSLFETHSNQPTVTDNLPETTVNELLPEEEAAIEAITTLKSVLKNPNSMQVHAISYCDGEADKWYIDSILENYGTAYGSIANYLYYKYTFKIDISAENGFGGMSRETYYLSYKDGYVSTTQLDENIQERFQTLDMLSTMFIYDMDIEKLDWEA